MRWPCPDGPDGTSCARSRGAFAGGYRLAGRGGTGAYNAAMNKPAAPDGHGRRPFRRLAWWVAFAALAGFLLAEAT
ncbi:hypothetical protein CR3_2387 [Cupriavidus gilardii CR3]|nr:hypothetical protein CR3_2387 [Cupriavidus gilardii CR3]